jgi:hypothetical protein
LWDSDGDYKKNYAKTETWKKQRFSKNTKENGNHIEATQYGPSQIPTNITAKQ